ncbi:hypothetical protein ACRRTK_006022 [Alexandromys fortis]
MRGNQQLTLVSFLLLLLLPRDAAAAAKPQYVVLVPSQLDAGVPEKACVNLQHLNETVTLDIILQYEKQTTNLLTGQTVEKDSFYCSPFMISSVPASSAFIIVQIKGPTQNFTRTRPMQIRKAENIVFVQTDKPIYKPGQTVKFRVVSVDTSFHPLNETNPQRKRIFQWLNTDLQKGLHQLSFPLSAEPALGTYKVVVQKDSGKKTEHSFEVNEYVLPKFEVKVKLPKIISFLEEEFEVSACGLYTYGKPVPGLVTMSVCRRYSRFHSQCHGQNSQSICEEFSGQVRLVDEKNQPMPNKNITVRVDVSKYLSTFTTDEHGLVNLAIDTSNFTSSFMGIAVSYKDNNNCYDNWWLSEFHTQAHHSATRIFSPSKSYIHLELVLGTLSCGQTQEIRTQYILNRDLLKDEKDLTFYYLIKARGSIFSSGTHLLSLEQGNMKGVFSFPLQVEPGMAPVAQLLIYAILPDGEIVADTQKLEIEKCFANKVNLSFSPAQSLPASDANLKVTATPLSLCALRAVDQSVLLLKPEAELSPQSIYGLLPEKPPQGVHYGRNDENCIVVDDITHNGIVYTPKQDLGDDDMSSVFESVGLNIFTNSKIHKPRFCQPVRAYAGIGGGYRVAPQALPMAAVPTGNFRGMSYAMAVDSAMSEEFSEVEVRETVRKYFPETWIWDMVPLDVSGGSELAVKVPDSITEWKASAFCLSGATGLGLSPTISLTVFQPFFLELTLPYSVVRGEAFTLKATVFNYMSHSIRIRVDLENSPDFLAVPVGDHKDSHCIYGNGRKTVSWAVTPKSLDTELLDEWSLILPPNVVEGSARATHSVLDSVITVAVISNQIPLARIMTPNTVDTFGNMLTAFVLKAFAQAQSHIFIEKMHITKALNWLSGKQKENGCFEQSGHLLNNAMKGGVSDEVTLSAYITIALLEIPLSAEHSIVRNALYCLETAWASISGSQGSHVYTKALLAYAFALAGNQAKRSELLESLNKEAVKEEDSIHWRRPGNIQEAETPYYRPRAPSAEVEMTAYVLLAYLTALPSPSSEDLSSASQIVKWIIRQQNSYGGFSSTQDTVVALQALSKYGAATFTKSKKEVLVTIKSSGTYSQKFTVHNANRLLLQEVRLPDLPGNYITTVSGSGCAYLQTSLKYNILPKTEGRAPFTLQVNTLPINIDENHRTFQIHINVSYTGERSSSNMVIVDVKMVSGFIPVKSTVRKLQNQPNIQRTDVTTNHVLVYIEKLTSQSLSFSFLVEQDIPVKNLKPAPVKVYDYYETDEFAIEEYSAPFNTGYTVKELPQVSHSWL